MPLNLGVPPHVVRDLAGHAVTKVTMTIYAHTSMTEKQGALRRNRIPNLLIRSLIWTDLGQPRPAGRPTSTRHAGRVGLMEADLLALIVADPAVGHGQACSRGSRVPVSVVLDCLADGMSVSEIVTE